MLRDSFARMRNCIGCHIYSHSPSAVTYIHVFQGSETSQFTKANILSSFVPVSQLASNHGYTGAKSYDSGVLCNVSLKLEF